MLVFIKMLMGMTGRAPSPSDWLREATSEPIFLLRGVDGGSACQPGELGAVRLLIDTSNLHQCARKYPPHTPPPRAVTLHYRLGVYHRIESALMNTSESAEERQSNFY